MLAGAPRRQRRFPENPKSSPSQLRKEAGAIAWVVVVWAVFHQPRWPSVLPDPSRGVVQQRLRFWSQLTTRYSVIVTSD